jgi:hypothetical protein
VERYLPGEPVDLVMLFDAFHHLIDPAAFVRRIGSRTDRFLLVEPAGTVTGGWQCGLDLDWLPLAVDTIRARAAWQFGHDAERAAPAPPGAGPPAEGRAVEQRYPLDDFIRFFDGFGLEVHGTIAGLEVYPPGAYGSRALADTFGRIACDAMTALEERLVAEQLDLHAKHWVIHAVRGRSHALRTPRPLPRAEGAPPPPLQGPYEAEYAADVPGRVDAGAAFRASVRLTNRSWRAWASTGPTPIMASYHWFEGGSHTPVVFDGERTPLPGVLSPGDSCDLSMAIVAPPAPGRYTLEIDLVHEHVTWFTGAGTPGWRATITVAR